MALLLIDKETDVNAASTDGTTPLHIASGTIHTDINQRYLSPYIDAGNSDVVKSLISHGAVQKMDASGYTPAMTASKAGNKELETVLKDLKIDYTTVSNKEQPKSKTDELKQKVQERC